MSKSKKSFSKIKDAAVETVKAKTCVLFVRNFNNKTKLKLQMWCLEHGKSLKNVLTALANGLIDGEIKLPKKKKEKDGE